MHPISSILFKIYDKLLSNQQVFFPLLPEQKEKIDSIVKTVEGKFFEKEHFPTQADKAAAYFYFLIKDHPLTDGNKRMAVLWLEIYCEVVGLTISLPKDITLDQMAVGVEKLQLPSDVSVEIIKTFLFLKPNT